MALRVTDVDVVHIKDLVELVREHGVYSLKLHHAGCCTDAALITVAAPTVRMVAVDDENLDWLVATPFAAMESLIFTDYGDHGLRLDSLALAMVPARGLRAFTLCAPHQEGIDAATLAAMMPERLTHLNMSIMLLDVRLLVERCALLTHVTYGCDDELQLCEAAIAFGRAPRLAHMALIVQTSVLSATVATLNKHVPRIVRLEIAALKIKGDLHADIISVEQLYGGSTKGNAVIRTTANTSFTVLQAGTRLELYSSDYARSGHVHLLDATGSSHSHGYELLQGGTIHTTIGRGDTLDNSLSVHYDDIRLLVLNVEAFNERDECYFRQLAMMGPELRHLECRTLSAAGAAVALNGVLARCPKLTSLTLRCRFRYDDLAAMPLSMEHLCVPLGKFGKRWPDVVRWPALKSVKFSDGDAKGVLPVFVKAITVHPAVLARPTCSSTLFAEHPDYGVECDVHCAGLRARLLQPLHTAAPWTRAAHTALVNPLVVAFLLGMQRMTECGEDLLLAYLQHVPMGMLRGI